MSVVKKGDGMEDMDNWEIALWVGAALSLIVVGVGFGFLIMGLWGNRPGSRLYFWLLLHPVETIWYPIWFGLMAAVAFVGVAISHRNERELKKEGHERLREWKEKRQAD